MFFTSEEREARRKYVFEAMGGWLGTHEIEPIVSDRARLVSTIEFYENQTNELEKEFDKPDMDNRRARHVEKLQSRNRKFVKALRAFLETVEE